MIFKKWILTSSFINTANRGGIKIGEAVTSRDVTSRIEKCQTCRLGKSQQSSGGEQVCVGGFQARGAIFKMYASFSKLLRKEMFTLEMEMWQRFQWFPTHGLSQHQAKISAFHGNIYRKLGNKLIQIWGLYLGKGQPRMQDNVIKKTWKQHY